MLSVIGDVLPLAVGIAISPIPIIAAILMLLAPQATGASVGFLLGWIVGIVIALVVFIALASVIPQGAAEESQPIAGAVKVVLGGLMLLLSIMQWRRRPARGTEPALPTWMAAIDQVTMVKAIGLGFLLAAVNPKNLLLGASAGVIIGSAGLTVTSTAVVVLIFTLIAAVSVAVPVIGYLVARTAMVGPLESLRGWLVHNNAVVMSVLLLVIGVTVVGKGIASF